MTSTDYRLIDSTLRDGSHAISHQYYAEDVMTIVAGLDAAGVQVIEIAHGDGLGGSSFQYGFSAIDEKELIAKACETATKAEIACLLIPGIGTVDDLRDVHEVGVKVARIATHCTEADVSEQHITVGRKLGLDTVGFLMMAHLNTPEKLAQQAKLMEGYGAECVYVTDSAGYLLPDGVTDRVAALRAVLRPETQIGFHGHHNMAMGVANSLAAIEAGAIRIDGSTNGLGAGAGNTPLEVFVAVCNRMGIETGVDLYKIMDVAEDIVLPMMDHMVRIDREALTLGYAGVYSTFLLFAKRAAIKYNVPARDILVELGRLGMVAGQEDMIEDTAMTMAKERGLAA